MLCFPSQSLQISASENGFTCELDCSLSMSRFVTLGTTTMAMTTTTTTESPPAEAGPPTEPGPDGKF